MELPKVERIGNNAFKDCTGLEKITIPKSTTIIGSDAFKGTTKLRYIIIEQLRDGGVVPSGHDSKVEVVYLDDKVTIEYTIKRQDANNFNIDVVYNGNGEVLTEIKATEQADETSNLNIKEERTYAYNVKDLKILEQKTYTFIASGSYSSKPADYPRTTEERVNITGFVNYIDENGNHLIDIPVDKKPYNVGDTVTLTTDIPQDKVNNYKFIGWSLQPNGTKDDVVANVVMTDQNINLYPVFEKNVTTSSSTSTTESTTSTSSTESTTSTSSTESSTESTTSTSATESSTESTTSTGATESSTESTTNDAQVIPPNNGGGNNNGGSNNSINDTVVNNNGVNDGSNIYTFGNLDIVTPEYEEMARQAISQVEPNNEIINSSIDSAIEDATINGSKINERRQTEKPAFGFSSEGNISLLIILLIILIIIIAAYTIKKQIIDKEKQQNEDEEKDASLTI